MPSSVEPAPGRRKRKPSVRLADYSELTDDSVKPAGTMPELTARKQGGIERRAGQPKTKRASGKQKKSIPNPPW